MGSALSAIASSKIVDRSSSPLNARDSFLFSIHQPQYDPETLEQSHRNVLNAVNNIRDVANTPPEAHPSYSQQEQSAVELWRRQVGDHVDARIAAYRCRETDTVQTAHKRRTHHRFEHKVIQIPELLDLILHFAGPEAQVRSLVISTAWEASALSVIGSCNNNDALPFLSACVPIQYGQSIEDDILAPERPSAEQIEHFDLHVASTLKRLAGRNRSKYVYFPAHFAQLRDLPETSAQSLSRLDRSQANHNFHDPPQPVSRSAGVYWLDLTQLQINPYFCLLFSEDNRILQRLGRWEISIRSSPTFNTLLLDSSASTKLFVKAIASMQVTHPPCRSLGIYQYSTDGLTGWGTHALMRRLRRDDGIRVDDLLDALHSLAPEMLSTWVQNAEQLRDDIKGAHWIDDHWKIPGTPRFRIHLDHSDMLDEPSPAMPRDVEEDVGAVLGYAAHITRTAYMAAEPFRGSREREWVPEKLFEPMKSETNRYPINWNI